MTLRALRWMFVAGVSGCVAESGADSDGSSGSATDSGSSGDTGDPIGGTCEKHPVVVADPSQAGMTGVTAMEVLAEVEGTYQGSIHWIAGPPTNYVGSTDATPFTLEITYAGGEIRDVDAVLVQPCDHNGPCPCEDSFEVDVTWRIVSDDGVLDETWTAPVVHEPNSFSMATDLGIRSEFQPDDTNGSLSADSFALDDGTILRELVAQAELDSGAALGSISAEVEIDIGAIGYGSIANFAAVREITSASCNAIRGEENCAATGCTPITGQRLQGTPPEDCSCSAPESFCFAAAPEADAMLTLYTRVYADAFETWDEVVALPSFGDSTPEPWRACADAPEVAACSCFADAVPCS